MKQNNTIVSQKYFNEVYVSLQPHFQSITGKKCKALNDIIFNVAGCLVMSGIDPKQYLKDYSQDKIFDPNCLFKDDVLVFNYFNKNYKRFAEILYSRRSTGLGTPHAASGEGELMAFACSPKVTISKKKGRGDLIVSKKTIEMKGDGVQITSSISGKDFYKSSIIIGKKYSFQPNKNRSYAQGAFEPYDIGKKANHWKAEFQKSGNKKASDFLFELMNATGAAYSRASINSCFPKGIFSPEQLQREMLKAMFLSNTTQQKWDYLSTIKNGIIRTITGDPKQWNKLVDDEVIIPSGNFFRINQHNPLGWYYKFA